MVPLDINWAPDVSPDIVDDPAAELEGYLLGSPNYSPVCQILSQLQAADREYLQPLQTPSLANRRTLFQQKQRLPRLFSEVSGLIGLAPSTVREDDLLCQFKECDVECIIRPLEDGRMKIIRRAVIAKPLGDPEKTVSSSSTELFRYNVPDPVSLAVLEEAILEIDVSLLQTLTYPTSKEPQYELNIILEALNDSTDESEDEY